MPHEYRWAHEGPAPKVPAPSGTFSLELPAAAGSSLSPAYPVQGTFRLEYRQERMDPDSRLWHCSARLMNLKDGMQSCVWHEDDILEEPGTPIGDTVMRRYLAWAGREKEKAIAMFLVMQRAWDALHPDEFPDHP